ncbi:Nucleoside-diphosphate-sugar pyrophosphorylase involved in lipopolysaccharide biosynthesis/translation initiation factor 2B, gamma/epsilon subunits (eIF-2Bgamma/eIF-2Bepsilon) [Thermoplasmatales archaeon BRNA1]|nr:Nucleoside-diphosphate-sugar pyrophosphorylase involved in lipopolysaccharide biosynthesis/translation initiation factor 2B, gamma/epsilon subunits (eIF-2Bgamma/eIF-2Bepsilon) [Thermoplasmatales archaeon BRNA1]
MSPEVRQAVIMVGGLGTRLLPLTETRPKPAMPVLDRPFLKYLIDSIARAGIEEVILACGYKSDILAKEIGDGSDMGVRILYSDEDTPLGTGGAIKSLEDRLDDVFVAANGDTLTSVDVGAQIEEHFSSGAMVTVSLSEVEDPSSSGVAVIDSEGRITAFQEKPKREEALSHLVNSGLYVVDKRVLRYIPEKSFYDFSKELFPLLLEKGERMQGHMARGIWIDIGKPLDLIRMNLTMAERLYPGQDWSGRVTESDVKGTFYIGEGSEFSHSASSDSVVSEGCTIKESKLSGSFIMKGSCIEGATVVRSIVGEGCIIKNGSVVTDSVLRDGTVLEAGSVTVGRMG